MHGVFVIAHQYRQQSFCCDVLNLFFEHRRLDRETEAPPIRQRSRVRLHKLSRCETNTTVSVVTTTPRCPPAVHPDKSNRPEQQILAGARNIKTVT